MSRSLRPKIWKVGPEWAFYDMSPNFFDRPTAHAHFLSFAEKCHIGTIQLLSNWWKINCGIVSGTCLEQLFDKSRKRECANWSLTIWLATNFSNSDSCTSLSVSASGPPLVESVTDIFSGICPTTSTSLNWRCNRTLWTMILTHSLGMLYSPELAACLMLPSGEILCLLH